MNIHNINKFIDRFYPWLFILLAFILVRKTFLVFSGSDMNVVHEDLTLFTNFSEYKQFFLEGFNNFYDVSSIRSLYYYVFLIGRLIYIFPFFIWVVTAALGISYYFSAKKILFLLTNKLYGGLGLFIVSFLYLLFFFITKGHHFYHVLPGAALFPIQLWILMELAQEKVKVFNNFKSYLFLATILIGGNVHHLLLVMAIVWISVLFLSRKLLPLALASTAALLILMYPSYLMGNAMETTPLIQSFQEQAGSYTTYLTNPFERILTTEISISYEKKFIPFLVYFVCLIIAFGAIFYKEKIINKKIFVFLYGLTLTTFILSFGLSFKPYEHIYKLLAVPVLGKFFALWLNIFRFPTRLMFVTVTIMLLLTLLVINHKRIYLYTFVFFVIGQIVILSPIASIFRGDLGGRLLPTTFNKIKDLPKEARVLYYPTFMSAYQNNKWITQEFIILNNGYHSFETSNSGGTEFNFKYGMLPYFLVQNKQLSDKKINDYYANWGVDYIVLYKNIQVPDKNLMLSPEFQDLFAKSNLHKVSESYEYDVYKTEPVRQKQKIFYGTLDEYWQRGLYEQNYIFLDTRLTSSQEKSDQVPLVPERKQLSMPELYRLFGKEFLNIQKFISPSSCYQNFEVCTSTNANSLSLTEAQFKIAREYISSLHPHNKIDYFVHGHTYYLNYYYNHLATLQTKQETNNVIVKYIFTSLCFIALLHLIIMSRRKHIIISGIDGSGKTTLATALSEQGFGQQYHYYDLVKRKRTGGDFHKTSKTYSNFITSLVKESVYALIKLVQLIMISHRKNIIIDRVFIDVYLDLTSRFGYHASLRVFTLLQKLFDIFFYPSTRKIFLTISDYQHIVQRKTDETEGSAMRKLALYKGHAGLYKNYLKISSQHYSQQEVLKQAVAYVNK